MHTNTIFAYTFRVYYGLSATYIRMFARKGGWQVHLCIRALATRLLSLRMHTSLVCICMYMCVYIYTYTYTSLFSSPMADEAVNASDCAHISWQVTVVCVHPQPGTQEQEDYQAWARPLVACRQVACLQECPLECQGDLFRTRLYND